MGWKGLLFEAPVWAMSRLRATGEDPRSRAPREILVLRPNDFGDLLTTTPLFEALRVRFPSSRIVAGIGRWGRAVLENNPFVDEIVEIDAPWNNKFVPGRSLADQLRYVWHSEQVEALRQRGGFDVGIDVLGSHIGAMLMMRLGVRYRIGVCGYRGGWSACQSYIRFSPEVHVARAALAQAELIGATVLPDLRPQIYLTDAEHAQAAAIWGAAQPQGDVVRVLVGCAAGLEEKSWPAQAQSAALREVSNALTSMGRTPQILVCGGPADKACALGIVAGSGVQSGVRSVAGETSLRTTFALAKQADVVITNPSMLLHVAAAFRRPTVAVLGGVFANAAEHDGVWGYGAPYSSVAPSRIVAGAHQQNWPSAEQVVAAVLDALGRQDALVQAGVGHGAAGQRAE